MNYIKKIQLVILIIIVAGILSSCNNVAIQETFSILSYKNEEHYTLFRQSDFTVGKFLQTPYGFFYKSFNEYLYYSKDGHMKYTKLCGKPDCSHNTKDCNAYIGISPIGYYNHKLYYFVRNTLFTMNMDGNEHKRVKTLYEGMDGHFGYFHNGYYYFVITKGGSIGFSGNDDNNLYAVKVDDSSKPVILLTDDIIKTITMFNLVGDNIYFFNYNLGNFELYSYSMITKELMKLGNKWSTYGSCYFDDKFGYCYLPNEGFYEYDIYGKDLVNVKPVKFEDEGICSAFYYSDYIYLVHYCGEKPSHENQILYIYDRKYNLVDSINFDKVVGKWSMGGFITDVGDYILYASDFNDKPDYYIDKSEIGTGELKFHKIED